MAEHQVRNHVSRSVPSLDHDPVVVFWELTRACALACRHCRASAQPKRNPEELTTEECFQVMDDLALFDLPPIVVLTGGDPLMRRDLFEIVSYGSAQGFRIAVAPSATALATKKRLRSLSEAGVSRISFSLDGPGPETHDLFRGMPGSFHRTLQCISDAAEAGLSTQVNTTVTRRNIDDLPHLEELVASLGSSVWDLFFLVPTGRGLVEDMLEPDGHDKAFHWIYQMERRAPFSVKVTLGQPYRRVRLTNELQEAGVDYNELRPEELLDLWEGVVPTNDGKGVLFISHVGEVQPSGFLPLPVGNVRFDSVAALYRRSALFRSLRAADQLKGKCGVCPFRMLCGGCRARAYGLTGDALAGDPTCPFIPYGIEN